MSTIRFSFFSNYFSSSEFAVLEVPREDEFSPLKNGPGAGSNCPETARQDLINAHYRFITNAGGRFVNADGVTLSTDMKYVVGFIFCFVVVFCLQKHKHTGTYIASRLITRVPVIAATIFSCCCCQKAAQTGTRGFCMQKAARAN